MDNKSLSYHQKSCRLCKTENLSRFLELVSTPAGNNFLTLDEKALGYEPIFPLELYFCNSCFHIQLGHVVDPKHLFKNYHFVSGTSQVNINHFESYADNVITRFGLQENSFILDIGSNDGTCLDAFKRRGMRVLGVDPADNIAQIANERGIETIANFFDIDLAYEIKEKFGTPDLITSHNVLAHIEDFSGVMEAVSYLLDSDSIFIFEVGYFSEVFQNLWFDTIYHEHLDYHTVAPLKAFFESISMELFDVQTIDIQGGSIRSFVQLESGSNILSASVDKLITSEIKHGLTNVTNLRNFQTEINIVKDDLLKMLKRFKNDGLRIAGYGAPTKSTTLMNYFCLDSSIIDFIIDDNELKQGKYSPLLHIPIVSSDYIADGNESDYMLILAWNFADSIIEKVRKTNNFNGKFVVPLPKPIII